MAVSIALLVWLCAAWSSLVAALVEIDPPEIDCNLRSLVLQRSQELLPPGSNLQAVFDALQLQECEENALPRDKIYSGSEECSVKNPAPIQLWVSTSGSDISGDGSMEAPLATFEHAQSLLRRRRYGVSDLSQQRADILIRGGKYFLEKSLQLSELDSYVRFIACPGEEVVLSGATRFRDLEFSRHGPQIFAAKMPRHLTGVDQLFTCQDSQDAVCSRMVWAREPNGNADTDLQPQGYALAAGNPLGDKPLPPGAAPYKPLEALLPERNSTWFPFYGRDKDPRGHGGKGWMQLHSDGEASYYADRRDFWNQTMPAGLAWNSTGVLTQHGYVQAFNATGWASIQDHPKPILHCMHASEWGNHIWEIDEIDIENRTFYLGRGGWQEGRYIGISTNPFYVEGARAALDHPGEWWLDEHDDILYLIPNITVPGTIDTISLDVAFPSLQVLVNISGSQDQTASSISLSGITFTQTKRTLLEQYIVPSPGDWSVHPGGVVQATHADNISIDQCIFNRTGGNAIAFVGGVDASSITRNEIAHIGDSAVVLIGRLPGLGNNGTFRAGEPLHYPRDTLISSNHIHDIGVWGKQVSALFQAVTCKTKFTQNVVYNGPRAGVNFNDGFCGGHVISENVLFNWVRETQDHGPINTWDRATYVQPHGGLYPNWNRIVRNLIMNGPSGNRDLGNLFPAVDNDDGSAYYWIAENVVAYGGFKNFLGNDKVWIDNLLLYPNGRTVSSGNGPCVMAWGGKNEAYENNTCVTRGTAGPGISPYPAPDKACSYSDPAKRLALLHLARNSYFTHTGSYQISCGGALNLTDMQRLGQEVGSTVGVVPPSKELLAHAQRLLRMASFEHVSITI